MARVVLLDASPLGMAAGPPGRPQTARCLAWLLTLEAAGVDVLVPEIADYEIRREAIRRSQTAGLRRLDELQNRLGYLELNTVAMRHAARFWAEVRNMGGPTAGDEALDADAILAGQAMTASQPGDVVTIATSNLRHLSRFPGIIAEEWRTLVS